MNLRDAAIRPCLILTFTAGLAGCQEPGTGTIKADRKTAEQLQRATGGQPAPTSKLKSKNARKQPDYNDRSSRFPGAEGQP